MKTKITGSHIIMLLNSVSRQKDMYTAVVLIAKLKIISVVSHASDFVT